MPKKRWNLHFWAVFRFERPVSTIFPPYIIPNGAYEIINKFSDTLPLKAFTCHVLERRAIMQIVLKPSANSVLPSQSKCYLQLSNNLQDQNRLCKYVWIQEDSRKHSQGQQGGNVSLKPTTCLYSTTEFLSSKLFS